MDSIIQKHALLIVLPFLRIHHRTTRRRRSPVSATWSHASSTRSTRRIVRTSRTFSTRSSNSPTSKTITVMWRTYSMWIPTPRVVPPSRSRRYPLRPERRTTRTSLWPRSAVRVRHDDLSLLPERVVSTIGQGGLRDSCLCILLPRWHYRDSAEPGPEGKVGYKRLRS